MVRAVMMNATEQAEKPMNTTILNYPGFQTLPKGVRQMLLVSEAYFFNESAAESQEQKAVAKHFSRGYENFARFPLLPVAFPAPQPA